MLSAHPLRNSELWWVTFGAGRDPNQNADSVVASMTCVLLGFSDGVTLGCVFRIWLACRWGHLMMPIHRLAKLIDAEEKS
jgi:hypothetical protein